MIKHQSRNCMSSFLLEIIIKDELKNEEGSHKLFFGYMCRILIVFLNDKCKVDDEITCQRNDSQNDMEMGMKQTATHTV